MYLLLLIFWIILNGKISLVIVLFGGILATLMFLFMCKFMNYSIRKEKLLYKRSWFLIKYVIILIIEILKANIAVIKLVLMSRYELEPIIVTFDTKLRSKFARVLLANSITLTPGTITVNVEKSTYQVHCLDKELAEGIEKSVFVKLLEKMEGLEA